MAPYKNYNFIFSKKSLKETDINFLQYIPGLKRISMEINYNLFNKVSHSISIDITLNYSEGKVEIHATLLVRLCDLVASLVLILCTSMKKEEFIRLHSRNFSQHSGCKDIGIRRFEFVAKTQFLYTHL